jgi:hypothetical protein
LQIAPIKSVIFNHTHPVRSLSFSFSWNTFKKLLGYLKADGIPKDLKADGIPKRLMGYLNRDGIPKVQLNQTFLWLRVEKFNFERKIKN